MEAEAKPLKLPVNRRVDERHRSVTEDGLSVWYTIQVSPHSRIYDVLFERADRMPSDEECRAWLELLIPGQGGGRVPIAAGQLRPPLRLLRAGSDPRSSAGLNAVVRPNEPGRRRAAAESGRRRARRHRAARPRHLRARRVDHRRPAGRDRLPANTAEVSLVMRIAQAQGLAVVPRGAGTGLSGGAVTLRGGIALSLARMHRILEIDPRSRTATVEPGVVNADLSVEAARHGSSTPPTPPRRRPARSAATRPRTRAARTASTTA